MLLVQVCPGRRGRGLQPDGQQPGLVPAHPHRASQGTPTAFPFLYLNLSKNNQALFFLLVLHLVSFYIRPLWRCDQEEPFLAVDAGGQSEATPFFTSTASTILIRGGKVVNAEEETEADVLVVEGIITKVEPDISAPDGAMIIDARSEFANVHLVVFTV